MHKSDHVQDNMKRLSIWRVNSLVVLLICAIKVTKHDFVIHLHSHGSKEGVENRGRSPMLLFLSHPSGHCLSK